MWERLMITIINLFCPPLAVMIIAGVGPDCLINTLLFIAGVIPGHIHGFYISCTYYNRKRKVRKGRFPGGRKSFVYSSRVINGGASDERVRELWMEQVEGRIGDKRRNGVGGEGKRSRVESERRIEGGREEMTWDGRRESRRTYRCA